MSETEQRLANTRERVEGWQHGEHISSGQAALDAIWLLSQLDEARAELKTLKDSFRSCGACGMLTTDYTVEHLMGEART